MKVPVGWLKEFVDVPVEVPRLAEDLTLAGLAVDAIHGAGAEAVLELDITTNRVDAMNVYGVAREVSVLYGRPLRPLALDFPESGEPGEQAWSVAIEAPDLCPRFCGLVLDVRVGPSPFWLRARLEAVGVRPISNLVDLSNYVMMEMGHPSHAFDLAKVPGGHLVVRWNQPGEKVVTLDGQERTLSARIGVIGGTAGALGLAGIMGGASSEVSDSTRTVALEAAYWDPLSIRRAAKSLGMHTEASHRFERGADPEGPPIALARVAHLAAKIGAGTARPGLIDKRPAPRPRTGALLRPARVASVVGVAVPEAESLRILGGLGFAVGEARDGAWPVEVPTWRGDVTREIDLVEEVARHHGLGRVPSTIPPARRAEGLRKEQRRDRRLRDVLSGAGLSEVVTYSFVSEEGALGPAPHIVELANPLSAEQAVLRASIVFPGLLQSLHTNVRQGRRDVRLFEMGRIFRRRSAGDGSLAGIDQPVRLGILLAGRAPGHWSSAARALDLFDLKGLVELLAERFGVPVPRLLPAEHGALHPGQSAMLEPLAGEPPGEYVGVLHPDVAARWGLREAPLVAELDPARFDRSLGVRTRSLPRFPSVERDLSVVVPLGEAAEGLLQEVRRAAGELLRDAHVVDRYDRPPVAAGHVSLTLALTYQDPERTLTSEEVQASVDEVIAAVRARGFDIRSD